MERLQAAIEKARAQREAVQSRTKEHKVAAPGMPEPVATGPWDEIKLESWNTDRLRRNRVVTAESSSEGGYFDMLRTRIIQMARENDWKRIAITSPDKAAGKSTLCANLIASLSRQRDRRSILMDLDMRRPSIASIFGYKGEHGVADVLSGTVPFSQQAVRFKDNIAVSMNYRPAPSPTELLHRHSTVDVLKRIEDEYEPDIFLFDMPPMMMTDDTLAFLKNVDAALLVAGAEATTIDQIDLCEKDIARQTNFLGVVLNKCHYMPETSYGYGYY